MEYRLVKQNKQCDLYCELAPVFVMCVSVLFRLPKREGSPCSSGHSTALVRRLEEAW